MTFTLAQGARSWLEVPEPRPLPDPPFLQHLLLEQPWPVVAALAGVAVIAFFWLRSRGSVKQAALAGAGVLALAAGAWLLADQTTTSREAATSAVRDLVRGVAEADVAALDRRLAGNVIAEYSGITLPVNKGAILALVSRQFASGGVYRVKDWGIEEVQADVARPGFAQALVKVRVVSEMSGFPVRSWWAIDLREEGGEWRAEAIVQESMNGWERGK
jgi:hypothetical protein